MKRDIHLSRKISTPGLQNSADLPWILPNRTRALPSWSSKFLVVRRWLRWWYFTVWMMPYTFAEHDNRAKLNNMKTLTLSWYHYRQTFTYDVNKRSSNSDVSEYWWIALMCEILFYSCSQRKEGALHVDNIKIKFIFYYSKWACRNTE